MWFFFAFLMTLLVKPRSRYSNERILFIALFILSIFISSSSSIGIDISFTSDVYGLKVSKVLIISIFVMQVNRELFKKSLQ